MVRKTTMSSANGGGEGETGEPQHRGKDDLSSTKDKMRLQQRLIDMAARDLESTRLSRKEIAPGSEHALHALEENILLQENKLMKYFSRQLMHKHQHLHLHPRDEETTADVERQLDNLISLNMFLTITGIEQRTVQVLNEAEIAEGITLDLLFSMNPHDLHQLFLRLDLPQEDLHKIVRLLDLLSYYFDIWERGEKPTAGAYDIRRYSSSGRLSSIASIASLDNNRKDSCSSRLSTMSPTTGPQQQQSRSSTPVTPLTPSSVHSIPPAPTTSQPAAVAVTSLALPHQQHSSPALLTSSVESSPPFSKKSSSGSSSGYFIGSEQLVHSYSSCSSLNSDMSAPQPPPPPPPPVTQLEEPPRPKRRLGHTRSHSNPPLANLILPVAVPENEVASDYRSPSPPYLTSTALSTRTGSQPSIAQHMLNSPSTKTHPQMRRVMACDPRFSRSISQELNGSEVRPIASTEAPLRSNSEASGVQSAAPRQRKLSRDTGTSTSMVDLPLVRMSNEDLDHVEYPLPQAGKSYSVPRLAYNAVNGDNSLERGNHHSTSVPTSPRVPSEYNPTGVMGHAIRHRFVGKTFLKAHFCDVCKTRLVMQGYKCKDCKFKCHKVCAKQAPMSCGLSSELIKYFKHHVLQNSSAPSLENMIHQVQLNHHQKQQLHGQMRGRTTASVSSSTQNSPQTPPAGLSQRRLDAAELVEDEDGQFMIQNLTREPFNSQYSPVVGRRYQGQGGSPVHDHEVFTHQNSSSRLEVPSAYHHPSPLHQQYYRPYHSTSSSPSTSPHSSPCVTPVSLHSPTEHLHMEYPSYASYTSGYTSSVPVIFTDDSADDDGFEGRQAGGRRARIRSEEDSQYISSSSSHSSHNDISDTDRLTGMAPRGLRPPPQVVSAQSLPNLLLPEELSANSPPNSFHSSEDNLKWQRESLVNTVSTADSKASTLVDSLPAEDDDTSSYAESDLYGGGSQGTVEETPEHRPVRLQHRPSVVDEWIIPYSELKVPEDPLVRNRGAEVFRAYWHGEVAVKRYYMPDASAEEIRQFKEKVSSLKKIRHDNLILFMGACLTPPNFAIVTSFSKGPTIYKRIHHWSDSFSVDKVVSISRQIAQAMGYLHARGIVHKNLTTRNVFLEKTVEKDKVVITDTGFSWFNTLEQRNGQGLYIDRTQLCYFAPEIMRKLEPELTEDFYPFTEMSDIYSFGTILYEMLMRKFPFTADPWGFTYESQVIVCMIATGKRQEIKNHDIPKKLKSLVWSCWSEDPSERPPFSDLRDRLARLLRKHTPITRSPSHPINLSKSVDNLVYI